MPYPLTFSSFFFYLYADHRDLHSFPTRRSSDLSSHRSIPCRANSSASRPPSTSSRAPSARSEEHTSELQSRLHLVCRLLLEKKKKKKKQYQYLMKLEVMMSSSFCGSEMESMYVT